MLPEFLFESDLGRYADLLRQHMEFLKLKTQVALAKAQTEFNRVQAFTQRQIGVNAQTFNFSQLRFHNYSPKAPSPKRHRLSQRRLVLVDDRPQVAQRNRIEID